MLHDVHQLLSRSTTGTLYRLKQIESEPQKQNEGLKEAEKQSDTYL